MEKIFGLKFYVLAVALNVSTEDDAEFFRQVRQEARRVTWATRQEVTVSTIMVLIMVVAASIFFFLVDSLIRLAVSAILPTG